MEAVGLRELMGVLTIAGSALGAYITLKVVLAEVVIRIDYLERTQTATQDANDALVDALQKLNVVLGKMEVKMEGFDKAIEKLEKNGEQ